jgi:pyruvate/2-oxoglutarate dehydrogenase complex dihydrolipoamide acyltransferase (E2) component
MVGSKTTSPHVLTAMEVDYDAVDRLRVVEKEAWRAAEGSPERQRRRRRADRAR